jgi:hypothetical protein
MSPSEGNMAGGVCYSIDSSKRYELKMGLWVFMTDIFVARYQIHLPFEAFFDAFAAELRVLGLSFATLMPEVTTGNLRYPRRAPD